MTKMLHVPAKCDNCRKVTEHEMYMETNTKWICQVCGKITQEK